MEFDQKQTEALILKIKAKDDRAFQEFYEEWYPKVYYIALAIMHHEADAKDVAQETMIEIHRSIHNLRDLKYFKLWLNRIILSKCNRIFRKKKAITMDMELRDALMSKEEERQEYLPSDYAHKKSDVEVLRTMLTKLQPIYAEVLVLMYYEQCSIKEMAEILKIPEGTVKSRLSSAKTKLKTEISEYEEKEQIKLSFHETTLEAMLVLAYAQWASNCKAPKADIKWKRSSYDFISLLTSNVIIIALSSIIALCGIGIGMELYRDYENDQRAQGIGQEEVRSFAPVWFKGLRISSDKDAYFVLMKYAHCDVEVAKLTDSEKNTIEELTKQLSYQGSIYYDLWLKRK